MREDIANPYTDETKHSFRQLQTRTNDKFHNFLSEFLYLAAEAGVAED